MVKRLIGIILVTGGLAAGVAVPVVTTVAGSTPAASAPLVYMHG